MSKINDSFIIAQMTDLHIGFHGKDELCQNSRRLRTAIQDINAMMLKPDIVVLTGDLVESGEDWAYVKLRSALKDLECPIFYAVGNHDNREAFKRNFPEVETNDGYVQYVIDDGPVRIIVLDTLKDGFHGGDFCEKRNDWLEKTLAQKPEKPTIIAMHHPPIDTGIAWMTADEEAPWVKRFCGTIQKHKNIIHVMAGHIHRPIFRKIEHTTLSVCEAIAPEVKLELASIDPNSPDNRPLILDSDPAYSVHHWNGKSLTSHAVTASSAKPLVKFDAQHSFIIQETMEKPQ